MQRSLAKDEQQGSECSFYFWCWDPRFSPIPLLAHLTVIPQMLSNNIPLLLSNAAGITAPWTYPEMSCFSLFIRLILLTPVQVSRHFWPLFPLKPIILIVKLISWLPCENLISFWNWYLFYLLWNITEYMINILDYFLTIAISVQNYSVIPLVSSHQATTLPTFW